MAVVGRSVGRSQIYAGFYRFILYLRVHPRIAVLVDTVNAMLDDTWHFLIPFMACFCVLACDAMRLRGRREKCRCRIP